VRAFDWCFRNRRTGAITIAQFPNLPLWIFLVTVALRRFVTVTGAPRVFADAVAVASLGWWAVDEVLRGVNPWRRALGVAGCGFAIAGLVSLVT
jgi:hypothetical protein